MESSLSADKIEWQVPGLSDQKKVDFVAALDFFHRVYRSADVDEDKFADQFRTFKRISGNTSSHQIPRVPVNLTKQK